MPSRHQKTDAYRVFETNIGRSKAFLRIFNKDRQRGQPSNDEKELLRGSLVFAVGALDAYLSDLILEIVPTYRPHSDQLAIALKDIAKADPGLALRVAITPSDRDRLQEFRQALAGWLETRSFQGVAKVKAALGYVGCPLTFPDFDKVTGVSTAKELERITDERHDIVHRGKKPYVKRTSASDIIDLVSSMAQLIDAKTSDLYL